MRRVMYRDNSRYIQKIYCVEDKIALPDQIPRILASNPPRALLYREMRINPFQSTHKRRYLWLADIRMIICLPIEVMYLD